MKASMDWEEEFGNHGDEGSLLFGVEQQAADAEVARVAQDMSPHPAAPEQKRP